MASTARPCCHPLYAYPVLDQDSWYRPAVLLRCAAMTAAAIAATATLSCTVAAICPALSCMQASGEYMLSTAVQASPECCVSNLMLKADKHGSVLSTAAFMEVLEDNGDMQVGVCICRVGGLALKPA